MTTELPTTRDPRRWLILAVLCLSLMVVVIDNTVLNVAIPRLIDDLHASSTDIQWILDSYILVFAGLLLTAGSLSDRHGRRLGLVVGLVVFGLASLAASFATSPGQLIAARAVMGLGGAFLMPGTLSIVMTVFDVEERKKAIAIWSSVLMLGAVAGPTLGGFLLQHFWWGSVFLINVPIAAGRRGRGDTPSFRNHAARRALPTCSAPTLSTIGLGALVWAVIDSTQDGWTSPEVTTGLAVAAVGLVGFVWWERRTDAPDAAAGPVP